MRVPMILMTAAMLSVTVAACQTSGDAGKADREQTKPQESIGGGMDVKLQFSESSQWLGMTLDELKADRGQNPTDIYDVRMALIKPDWMSDERFLTVRAVAPMTQVLFPGYLFVLNDFQRVCEVRDVPDVQ